MPSEPKVTRKLRAILSADVKGYSFLMADDEGHTIRTLKAYQDLMADLIQPEIDNKVRDIKDMAAAAVLIAAIISLIIGLVIFIPKLPELF